MNDSQSDRHIHLRQQMENALSVEGLKTLCYDLGIDYENIPGGTKRLKIIGIIEHMDSERRLPHLVRTLKDKHPHYDWPHIAEPPEAPCPYKGLHTFQEEDAYLFFGREKDSQRLLTAVHHQPFTAVIGPSGSGKSSLVFAGLLPHLRLEKEGWIVIRFRPKNQPFLSLAEALVAELEPDLSQVDQLVETRKLADALQQGTMPLTDVASRLLDETKATHFLLVGDQFEELYTLCDDRERRRRFLDVLLALPAAALPDRQQTKLLLTLRADFLGWALSYPSLAVALQESDDVKLGPMTREELRQAIVKPAKEVQFEERLVDRILDDIAPAGRQPEPGDLPLLEFALTRLWENQASGRLTHVAYEKIGQVKGALAGYAEEVYDGLSEAEQTQLPPLMVQLVHPGAGTEDTRRLATRAELGEERWPLVKRLADARLVVTGRDEAADQETVEVIHETPIQHWGRLQEWMEAYRAFRQWQDHRLRPALAQWEASQRDSGALLRGAPLAEAERWLDEQGEALSEQEQAYIAASLQWREKEAAVKEAARQRELELERQRSTLLRRALVGAVVLVVIAGIAAYLAFTNANLASTRAMEAEEARATAIAEGNGRATQQARALESAREADAARATAEAESVSRATTEAEAIGSANVAATREAEAQRQRRLFVTQSLAVLSSTILQQLRPDSELATLLAIEAARINEQEAGHQAWLIDSSLRQALSTPFFSNVLHGHNNSVVTSVAFSPDGTRLASGSGDGAIRVWELDDPQAEPLLLIGHEEPVLSMAFSPDGARLVSGGFSGAVRLWELNDPQAVPALLSGQLVSPVAFSPDGTRLASGSGDGTIELWELDNPQAEPLLLTSHEGSTTLVAFNSDSTIRLLELDEPQTEPLLLTGHEEPVISVAFSPNGTWLASGGGDNTIRLWGLDDPQAEPLVLIGHEGGVASVAFSPDEKWLASGGGDTTIRLWELDDPQAAPLVLTGHEEPVTSVAFSPDGKWLASGSSDNTIRLWGLDDPQRAPLNLTDAGEWVLSVAFSPNGTRLAGGDLDGTIRLWELDDLQAEPLVLTGHEDWVTSVTFSRDERWLASSSRDTTIRLWELDDLQAAPLVLTGHEEPVTSVAFSPDGKWLASGSGDTTIRLWRLDDLQAAPLVLTGHEDWVRSVAFSPDGTWLASGSYDSTRRLWKLDDLQAAPLVLTGHEDDVTSVAFSPDGKWLASGSTDNTIRLWKPNTPQAVPLVLTGHEESVAFVTFGPDGKWLASGSGDNTIRLWELDHPQAEPLVLTGHENWVISVDFSPDGTQLASSSANGVIRLWLTLDGLLQLGCQKVRRNFTWAEWQRYLPGELYRPTCPNRPLDPNVPPDQIDPDYVTVVQQQNQ